MQEGSDWIGAIARAQAHSPFLALAMRRLPVITQLCREGHGEEALALAKAAAASPDAEAALRQERVGLALALGLGDLAGAFPLARVMGELSAFADRALDRAITTAIARRVADFDHATMPSGFVALALGKQGAGELNYSSDIDPILLFDPATLPMRERDDPGETAQRYARQIVDLLSRQTGDGRVFRVDLRLRPASEVSGLAISFGAALSHYESSALAWERAAYIRARAAAGDIAAGERFLSQIRAFVWHKSLDFTAIEEIRRLTARIREAYAGPTEPGPGFDIKRGRGGIREVEFFAQTHQLIYGGRVPALQVRGTRAALDALAAATIIPADDALILGQAYDRLRVIEHRLQVVEDRQTHSLPATVEALDNVAHLDGLADGAALLAELRDTCAQVAARYDKLLGIEQPRAATSAATAAPYSPEPSSEPALDPQLIERIAQWPQSIRTLKSKEALLAFDAIRPDLTAALAAAPDPNRALVRWETLLGQLPSIVNLFRLFEQRPGLLAQVLRVLTLARPLADELARRPALLDALIDPRALALPAPVSELAARMSLDDSADYEARLDRVRHVVGEERFLSGVQLIEARADPLAIAAGLSRVAEAALAVAAEAATREFAATHGSIPGGDLIILGLGRLGGGALTHASDLDIVYLFTSDIGVESTGRRPLTASLYFNRLAVRVTSALSVPTAEGALYPVDTRLRPQGNQGPLAVSVESFTRYQSLDAWTWEHMALARARPLFGPAPARAALSQAIHQILTRPRDPEALRAAVLTMRADIAANKPAKGPLDVKLLRGGLVDAEFVVHYLQLREGTALEPALDRAIAQLVERGLLPAEWCEHHALLTRLLVAARLLAPDGQMPPPAAAAALAQTCGEADATKLLHRLRAARQGIAQTWAVLFGQPLEIDP